MVDIGRDVQKTRNELTAGETGGQQVQGAQTQVLNLGEQQQQRQAQAFHSFDTLQEQQRASKAQEDLESQKIKERTATEADKQDIELADKGLQRQGPSRADLLLQEMNRGRQQQQMNKPLEVSGSGKTIGTTTKTPERAANDEAKSAATELDARARFNNSVRLLQQARATGDKDAAKEAGHNAQQYIESASRLLNNFKSAKATDTDWDDVKRLSTMMGDSHPDPALQQEIDSKTFGPRMNDFLRANVDQWALRYIAGTGDMPDGHLVDLASPMMSHLTMTAGKVQSYLKQADQMTGGAFSQGLKISSEAEKNRMVRKLAAEQLMLLGAQGGQQQGQPQQPQGGGGDMPIPSQGGPSARPQPSGAAIPSPGGGGPPLLPSRDANLQSAQRGLGGGGRGAAGAPAAAGSDADRARAEIERRKEYGFGGQR